MRIEGRNLGRARYSETVKDVFAQKLEALLSPGVSILDVGAGANPTVSVEQRTGHYVGVDIDGAALERANYDERYVSDICIFEPSLEGRFDLVVSSQLLEHVRSTQQAFDNIYRYLRPGGVTLNRLSGGWSAFAVANRLLPHPVARFVVRDVLRKRKRRVYPAHYDRCSMSGMQKNLARFQSCTILPLWCGASYFSWSPLAHALYLAYEDWTMRFADTAPYYVVVARR